MRPFRVAMALPCIDQDPGLTQRREALAVAQFVPEPGVEAPGLAVLPRGARLDAGGIRSNRSDPGLDVAGQTGPLSRPDEAGYAAAREQLG